MSQTSIEREAIRELEQDIVNKIREYPELKKENAYLKQKIQEYEDVYYKAKKFLEDNPQYKSQTQALTFEEAYISTGKQNIELQSKIAEFKEWSKLDGIIAVDPLKIADKIQEIFGEG